MDLSGVSRGVMAGSTQTTSLTVQPGLYVLRYLSSMQARTAPSAAVAPSPGCEDDIDILGAPGFRAGELAAPGSSIVILARRPGAVAVSVEAIPGSSNLDAKLSLELLAAGCEPTRAAFPESLDPTASRSIARVARAVSTDVSVHALAHVKWRGDIGPDAEGWIGGPQAPSAIEGVAFRCEGAAVGIAAQYRNSLDRQRWSPWQAPGDFAGTRQMASPLTGLRLKLAGADASRFQMQVEALFLGAPVAVERGPEVELRSGGGEDPLVGLRVALVALTKAPQGPDSVKPSRVRVFR